MSEDVVRVASVSATHVVLVAAAGIAVLFKRFDLVDILDGIGQLMHNVKVARAKLALAGDLFQLLAEHIAQVIHRFHTHCSFSFQLTRSMVRLLLAKLTASALVFFAATVTQQPRGTSTMALT